MLFLYMFLICVCISLLIITLFIGLNVIFELLEGFNGYGFFDKLIELTKIFIVSTCTLFGVFMFGSLVVYIIMHLAKMID